MNKHNILNGGQKRTLLGGPKERKARKSCQKALMAFRRVVFALTRQIKAQARIIPRTKARERTENEKARKELILNPDFQPLKHAVKKDMAMPGNRTTVTTPLNLANHPKHVVLDLGCTRSIGLRAAIERFKKHAWFYGITTEFFRCSKAFVFANSETESCMESCTVHFPKVPPCSTKLDVLETGVVPILFSLPRMKNLGMTIELDPKGDNITFPAFRLYSSPAEYSTTGHILLDATSLAYQPTTKSRERSGHPRRHVTFAMSERKPSISSSCTRHA